MMASAVWIWSNDDLGVNQYHQTRVFRKNFNVEDVDKIVDAKIKISADSYYRLKINQTIVNDGPARNYPDSYQYDLIDVKKFLKSGENQLDVVVIYYGAGTFHQIPQRGGLIADLSLTCANKHSQKIVTDGSWQVATLTPMVQFTAKVSVQQSVVEVYDNNLTIGEFHSALVIKNPPWQNLHERDCELLSRIDVDLREFVGSKLRRNNLVEFSYSERRLYFLNSISNNSSDVYPAILTLLAESSEDLNLKFYTLEVAIYCNGIKSENGVIQLKKGKNLLLIGASEYWHLKEKTVLFEKDSRVKFSNPFNFDGVSFILNSSLVYEGPDLPFNWANHEQKNHHKQSFDFINQIFGLIKSQTELLASSSLEIKTIPMSELNAVDGYSQSIYAPVVAENLSLVENPTGLMTQNSEPTIVGVTPDKDEFVELVYDFGEQNCGFWKLDVEAPKGTIIDFYAVEFIREDGVIQHTMAHRNVMRYICSEGRNIYTSIKRRAGRFLFIKVSQHTAEVKLNHISLVESTYPVKEYGKFNSSNEKLNTLWQMSAKTLKLCMEDTFTDCPLYEQTLWVGDARSEALFAFPVFKAYDLAKRCIKLAANSLNSYSIVGCQVPSSWDCLLPVWSFMWSLSIHDYYFESADVEFLESIWGSAVKNLDGAVARIDSSNGLFTSEDWNLFDWSKTDTEHKHVTFMSMFLAGAIEKSLELAKILNDHEFISKYSLILEKLKKAINRTWNSEIMSYSDSLTDDGKLSKESSIHVNMLAILFNLTTADNHSQVLENLRTKRSDLHQVCSPFASLYYYMTLEKLGENKRLIEEIQNDYATMLEYNESTVWETFVFMDPAYGFPTRSHCHGWSATPLYLFPRTLLGLQMITSGAKKFTCSPTIIEAIPNVNSTVATIMGEIEVSISRVGANIDIKIRKPEAIEIEFIKNLSMDKYIINFEIC